MQKRFVSDYNKLLDETKTPSKGRREEAELEQSAASRTKKTIESSRTYRDLIEGRFDVIKVIYVNWRSRETMENLKAQGYTDAQIAFDFAIKDG